MSTMRAVAVSDGVCVPVDLPAPDLVAGSVRIRVTASGVNRADLVQKAGLYPPPPGASPVLGLECAGVIAEVAEDVLGWKVGDRVCALLAGGGYASQVVVDARHVLPIPKGLTDEQAAAIVEVFATAWLNLMVEGRLRGRPGARVLIHAGGSGVGTAAVQIARVFGNPSFVTAGDDEKIARCVVLGADGGANRHTGWRDAVAAWAPDGVDMILDPVGGSYFADDLTVLALDGTLVLIGLMGGRSAQIDLGRMLMRRLHVAGSTLRARSDDYKAAAVADLLAHLWPHVESGTLVPVVDRSFPITDVEAAHAHVASNQTFGAVVLTH